ncbi:DUF6465 family protein [Pseudoramibacter sp.]|jgi:hypothetical protein|uniref:DUF6465 family protein n=1 Tax=Pseudoramibacter sp. TaxID=2034862 RepID=UPI0025D09BE9|nr:DUF6465 family protein [Pseudoramibacter sp.]MCH4071726.1 DUF6465 family protein [Pseudoramibacter sp.]MCH4105494.1 DUF6465 family protein [Pseudoramibacter sp.]
MARKLSKKSVQAAMPEVKAEKKAEVKAEVKAGAAKAAKTVADATAKTATAAKSAAKTGVKKAAARRSRGYKSEVIIQRRDFEVTSSGLVDHVKEIWTKEMGNLVRDLKDIKVYVNTEEAMAYYVINGDVNGKFAL